MAICDVTQGGIWGCCLGGKKCQKNMGGGAGQGSTFLGEISARPGTSVGGGWSRGPCGRGHAGSGLLSAYISVLFWCGLRELYICWAHKKSMCFHVLSACLLWIHPGRPSPCQPVGKGIPTLFPALAFPRLLNRYYVLQTRPKLTF